MANEQSGVKFFVIVTILCLSSRQCFGQDDDDGEGNPILDVMQSLLKDAGKGQQGGLNVLGPMLQGFLQSGGGKQLGDLFNGSGQKSPAVNILSGISALLQAQQASKNSNDNTGGFDPAMLGTVIDLFSSLNEAQSVGEKNNERASKPVTRKMKQENENAIDWGPVLSVVGNAVSSMMANSDKSNNQENNPMEAVLSFLPVLMSSVGGRHASHTSGNVKHHQHAPFLPPFLENLHEYWDHFTSSQFGRTLWENSGLAALAAQFQDESGSFVPTRLFDSLENNTFRRQWIRGISSFVAEWASHISDSETQKSTLTDEVFQRQLNLQINSAQYVKPAIDYFQDVFGQTKKSGLFSNISAQSIESKLSDTLENQLIEPVLRANRAYRFAVRNPQCSRYVLCVINYDRDTPQHAVGIKPAVIKIAGIATAWFLSTPTNVSFFDLIGTEGPCRQYDSNCSEFHDEDTKATTEYFHNEL